MRKTIVRRTIKEFTKFWNEKKGDGGNVIPFPTKPGDPQQDNDEDKKE